MRYSVNKIVSVRQERLAGYDIVALAFAEAYAELRQKCPTGNLHIHLSIDVDEPVFRDLGERDERGALRCASDRWPDGAPT